MAEDYHRPETNQRLTDRLDVDFALKAAKLGVWELDPDTGEVRWDDRCRELYGLARDNPMTYRQAIRHIHPNDADRVDEAMRRATVPHSDGDYDVTYRTIGADDGLLRWVRFTGQATFDEHQSVSRFAGVAQDVTENELARQLTESEERYRTMVEKAPVAIGVLRGEELIIESANDKVLDLLHKPASIIGKPWLEVLPELTDTPAIDVIRNVYQTGVPFTASEFPAQLEKDGVLHQGYYSFTYLPLTENGATSGILQVAIEITDQVVARQKAAESEAKFRALIQEAPVPTCLFVGRELVIEVANEAMIGLWGKGPSVLGKPLAQALPELRDQHFLQTIDEVFTTGITYETKAGRADLRIDGGLTTFYFDYTFKALRNTDGEIYAIMEMATDVTAEVTMKQKLRESEAYFRNLTDMVPAIVWETGPDGHCSYLNKRWYELTGQTFAEAEGFGWLNATHADDRAEASRLFLEANARQEVFNVLYRLRQADGTYCWCIDKANPRFAADGRYEGMIGTVVDIDQQVTASQQLVEQQAQFKNVTNSSPTGLWLSDEAGEVTYLNQTLIDWTGMPHEDLVGAGWAGAIISKDRERSITTFMTAVATRSHYEAVFRLQKADGHVIWCQAAGDPYYHPDGRCAGYAGFCMDITGQVLMQQRIEESQRRLLASFEAAPVGIAVIGHQNLTFLMANPFYAELIGRTPEQLVGKPLLEAMTELRGEGFDLLLENVFATGVPYVANEVAAQVYRHNRLETIYVNFSYTPQYEADGGEISSILVVAIDVAEQVTARRTIEESEQQYRTLSAHLDEQVQQRTQQLQDTVRDLERSNQNLQQFAYVASHDLQEPLRKIQSFGDILKTQYGSELGEGMDHLQRMQSAANRMSVLIKDLLGYSRIATRQDMSDTVPLGDVLRAVLIDLELVIGETGATIRVPPLPVVKGDSSQLGQLFQNLLSNALKFRQPHTPPVVTITAAHVPAPDLPANVRPARMAPAYYRLDIADNGIGFDEKYLDRIFQVFQRLHGRSNFAGTGIGLAVCEKVAANHGGAITAASQPGHGATFSVYLPV